MKKKCIRYTAVILLLLLAHQTHAQKLDSIVGYYFNTPSDSSKYQKNEFQYNADKLIISWKFLEWNDSKNDWNPSFTEVYNRNILNQVVEIVRSNWDAQKSQWIGEWKQEQSFDEQGNMTLLIYYNWDANSNSWQRYWKQEQEYDEQNNITLWAHYDWYSDSNSWIGNYKYTYQYDGADTISAYTYYFWDWTVSDWKLSTKEIYYYSGSTGMVVPTTPDLKLYPNPTSGLVHIGGYTQNMNIRILSAHGQLIKNERQNSPKIDISNLPAGLYYIELKAPDGSTVRKMIVKD